MTEINLKLFAETSVSVKFFDLYVYLQYTVRVRRETWKGNNN